MNPKSTAPPPLSNFRPRRSVPTLASMGTSPVMGGSRGSAMWGDELDEEEFQLSTNFSSPYRGGSSSAATTRKFATPQLSPLCNGMAPAPSQYQQQQQHCFFQHRAPSGARSESRELCPSRLSTQTTAEYRPRGSQASFDDLGGHTMGSITELPAYEPDAAAVDHLDDVTTALDVVALMGELPRALLDPLALVPISRQILSSASALWPAEEFCCRGAPLDVLPPPALQSAPSALPVYPTISTYWHRGPRKSYEDSSHSEYIDAFQPPAAFDFAPMSPLVPRPVSAGPPSLSRASSRTFFAAVFDGHNGSQASEIAEQTVHEYFRRSPHFETDVGAALVDALRALDVRLFESGAAGNSGTTALVACVRGRQLTLANLGDCRAVLGTRDGRALQLTQDHKASCPEEQLRIGALPLPLECGRIEGLAVSRGLGDFAMKTREGVYNGDGALSNVADIVTLTIDDECAFVVLATDGLWDKLSNADAVDIVRATADFSGSSGAAVAMMDDGADVDSDDDTPSRQRQPLPTAQTPRCPLSMAARELVNVAVNRNTSDNVTAMVLRLH